MKQLVVLATDNDDGSTEEWDMEVRSAFTRNGNISRKKDGPKRLTPADNKRLRKIRAPFNYNLPKQTLKQFDQGQAGACAGTGNNDSLRFASSGFEVDRVGFFRKRNRNNPAPSATDDFKIDDTGALILNNIAVPGLTANVLFSRDSNRLSSDVRRKRFVLRYQIRRLDDEVFTCGV